MSEKIAQIIGNFIGRFVVADANNFTGAWRSYMRIRVSIDTRQPLRRGMNISMQGCEGSWVKFTYENLPTFCFFCGVTGHTERSCRKYIQFPDKTAAKLYV